MIDYTGTTPKSYIYVLDVHGSVIGLADDSESTQSSGVVINYEYDAWGNLLNIPQTLLTGNGESLADANPFRYCGYQFDKETGFYYLKYRYYIPSLGRFLTRDPMMTGNRYVYCRNNPVNFVDPLGLDETRPIIYYYARTVYVPKKTGTKSLSGPRKTSSLEAFFNSTINTPGGMLAITTSASRYIINGIERGAIKAVQNQSFSSSIAKGMRPKVIAKEIAEVDWLHLTGQKN